MKRLKVQTYLFSILILKGLLTMTEKLKFLFRNYKAFFSFNLAVKSYVSSKIALGEAGVSLPWWCHAPVLSPPGYWGLFLNLIIFHNGRMTRFRGILGKSLTLKFHKVKLLKFKTFNFDLKFLWNWPFFHYEKIMRFKDSPQ